MSDAADLRPLAFAVAYRMLGSCASVLVEYARAWLESEESEPYRQMAAELDDDTDLR